MFEKPRNFLKLFYLILCMFVSAAAVQLSASTVVQFSPLEVLDASNATDARLDLDAVKAVFNENIMAERNVDSAVNYLLEASANEANSELHQVKSLLSIAHLYWRYGNFDAASESVDTANGMLETTDGQILKARVLDAQGRTADAVEWYEKARASTTLDGEREFIQIRLAMMDIDRTNVDTLYELAQQQDQNFKNRAAITLAIFGHPEKALDLYRADPANDKYFRQLIRIAEWAIVVEDYPTAQEHAWLAYKNTEIRFDGLYALTLLDESYRKAESIEKLIVELETRDELDEDLRHLHIDLLIDEERFDEAISLYRSIEIDPNDIDARYRLLQIFDTANRTDELIAEFERLIADEPKIVQWWTGLASHYVSVAEPEKAAEVWKQFEATNEDDIDVLIVGGVDMSQMGFEDESIEIVHRYNERYGPSTSGQIYLFETHLERGRDNLAVDALNELVEYLPADSGDLRLIADAFERLHRYESALDIFLNVEENTDDKLGYDDQMRLAWLHSVIGNREESMNLWQEIWLGENSPARRNFAEAQFLLIAAELNKLGDISIELEKKLYAGTADKNEVSLLVRIYTEVSDSFTASEVIEEFARSGGISEIDRLRHLGLIYLQLQEFEKYDGVLKELEKIDPDNRLEHVQNIILNLVAYRDATETDDQLEEIMFWLEELRNYDEEAVTGEFEANILSMSGFSQEAIDSYRLALVRQPKHSDNLLLMGELLKEENRTEEAVSIFQYVAEHSQDDNEFVVAIDGILNMIGQDYFGQRLSTQYQNIFRWTHRIILERITQREDKFYLYTLLGEIAQETNDMESEFVAIENSISQAGIRRLSVLRELFTMATPELGFFMSRRAGDEDRQLTYGRRLIGLRQQLPPSVYVNVAETLLRRDDPLGAEKSLDLIRDITGQVDPNQTKADLFQEAGYGKKALAFYSHALSLNQDDPELLLKTASLREGNGQTDVASTLYMKGLLNILRNQAAMLQTTPVVADPRMMMFSASQPNTGVNRTYTTYFESFAQGVLSTWPATTEEAVDKFNSVHGLFVNEMNAALDLIEEKGEIVDYTRYARLHNVVKFMRRLCMTYGYLDELQEMELTLAEVFSENADFVAATRRNYDESGTKIPDYLVSYLQSDEDAEAAPEISMDADLLTREFERAIAEKDVARIARLLKIAEPPQPPERIFQTIISEGDYILPLAYAKQIFDESEYIRMASSAVGALRDEPRKLFELISSSPDFVKDIEDSIGPMFESMDQLMDMFETDKGKEFLERTPFYLSRIWTYVSERFSGEELIGFFEFMLEKESDYYQGRFNYNSTRYVMTLLGMEWNRSERQLLEDSILDIIDSIDFQDEFVIMYVVDMVLVFDAHPSNLPVLLAAIEEVQMNTQFEYGFEDILELYYEDKRQQAFELLLQVEFEERYAYRIASLLGNNFREEAQAYLLKLLEDDCPTEEDIAFFTGPMANYLPSISSVAVEAGQEPDAMTRRLAECFPDNLDYRLQLLQRAIGQGKNKNIAEHFEAAYNVDITEESIRTAYFLWSKQQEDYITALAIARDGGDDLRKPEVLELIFSKNDASQNKWGPHPDAVLYVIRGSPTTDQLSSPFSGGTPQNLKRNAETIAALDETNTVEEAIDAVRLFWRNITLQNFGDDRPIYYYGDPTDGFINQFLNWPRDPEGAIQDPYMRFYYGSAGGSVVTSLAQYLRIQDQEEPVFDDSETLLAWLVQHFDLGEALETLLVSLSPKTRQTASAWYELVVDAYGYYPDSSAARLDALTQRVASGIANEHEYTLWLLLSNEQDTTPGAEELQIFEAWARTQHDMTDLQILNTARFYARNEDWDQAIDYYTLLTVNSINLDEFQDLARNVFYSPYDQPTSMSVYDIIDDTEGYLPPERRQALVRKVLPLAKGYDSVAEAEFTVDSFIIDMLSRVYPAEEVVAEAMEISPQIEDTAKFPNRRTSLQPFETLPILQLAKLEVSQANWDSALAYIEALFTLDQIESSKGDYSTEDSTDLVFRSAGYQIQQAMRMASSMTGITISMGTIGNIGYPFGGVEAAAPTSTVLMFSKHEQLFDFDNEIWMDRLISAMVEWLSHDEIDHRAVIELLAVIAYEYHLREEPENVAKVGDKISEWFGASLDELERSDLWPFATLAIKIEFPLIPTAVARIIEQELFDLEETIGMLQNLRETADPAAAMEAVKQIPVATSGLSVLRELVEIGRSVDNVEYSEQVQERIQALEAALEELEQTNAVSTSYIEE